MYRIFVASFLTLACLVGSPLLATEPAEVAEEESCQAFTPGKAEVADAWIPPFSLAATSASMENRDSMEKSDPGTYSVQPCYNLGQVRYIQTSYCCSNGKLREIKETCGPQHGTWGTWVWRYSGVYCIGLFCSGGGGDPL